jgi:asparagine synthase (glutamine-hydrolysing)
MSFVGLRWTPADFIRARAARSLAQRLTGWTTQVDWRGLLLLHDGKGAVEALPHGSGFVFGERYGRLEPDPSPPCETCVDPTPTWIKERSGEYVALLIDRGFDIVRVLRDPSGACPVFLSELDGVKIFFSDAGAFISLAPETEADLDFLRAFLRYPPFLSRRTGLKGVAELAPGECAKYPREGFAIEPYWTPQRFAQRAAPLDWVEGKAALRNSVETCINTRIARHSSISLRLSGGFDSSNMLGLIRRAGVADIVCVNEFWEGAPEGDERQLASAVADANHVRLHELRFDPQIVDFARCLKGPPTVKPNLSLLGLGNSETADFYDALDVTLVTSGQGGDHLFHRSRTPWIAADALSDGVAAKPMLQIAVDTAQLTGQSVWSIFSHMVRGTFAARPDFVQYSKVMGVLAPAHAAGELESDHAWLADLPRRSPARALRVYQLLQALSYFDEALYPGGAKMQPLLLSQPIVETCLRIAPYVMTAGGKERALARAAFADLAPEQVLHRTAKGETTRYFAAVLAVNKDWIWSLLPKGRLVEAGVIDTKAIKDALQRDWLQSGMAADGLYALIAAECWLRNLASAKASARLAQSGSAGAESAPTREAS